MKQDPLLVRWFDGSGESSYEHERFKTWISEPLSDEHDMTEQPDQVSVAFTILKPGFTDVKCVQQICDHLSLFSFRPIVISEVIRFPMAFWELMYAEHKGKSFYQGNLDYVSREDGVRVMFLVMEEKVFHYWDSDEECLSKSQHETLVYHSLNALSALDIVVRGDPENKKDLNFPSHASIRSLFGKSIRENTLHASDSPGALLREIRLLVDIFPIVHWGPSNSESPQWTKTLHQVMNSYETRHGRRKRQKVVT